MNRTAAVIELGILVLSLIGIRRASRHRESRLAQLLKTQGIVYFVMVTFMHVLLVVSDPGPIELTFSDTYTQRSRLTSQLAVGRGFVVPLSN